MILAGLIALMFMFLQASMVLALIGGAWACYANRHLSRHLLLAAWGFLGYALANACYFSRYWLPIGPIVSMFVGSLILTFLPMVSTGLLVLGVWRGLSEINRKMPTAKGPIDAWQ